jgi:hypothetical protein
VIELCLAGEPSAAAAGRPARVALFREAWIATDRAEAEAVWTPHAMKVHRLYFNVGVYRPEFEPWVSDVQDRADFSLGREVIEPLSTGSSSVR